MIEVWLSLIDLFLAERTLSDIETMEYRRDLPTDVAALQQLLVNKDNEVSAM